MTTIERIDLLLENRGIVPAQMMKAIGASTGLFSQWRSGLQKPSADKVVKIADYLDCSVDYLLGRTDNPNMSITVTQTGEIIESSPINAVNNAEKPSNEMTAELVRIFESLDFKKKMKVMNFVLKESENIG